MNIATVIISIFFIAIFFIGLSARYGRRMSAEEWAVGGRSLPTIFVFLLFAGEVFSTFTFMGGPSWSFSHGLASLFIPAYITLSCVIGYWILPPIWRYSKNHNLISQSSFFEHRYNSVTVGILVTIVGIVSLVPYLVLQLKGLKIIVELASYGRISGTSAVWIGAFITTAYVMVSGVRGSAWVSVLKDITLLSAAVFLGIYLPLHLYGSYGAMFTHVMNLAPQRLILGGENSPLWFSSTICLLSLGFYMWPHEFAATCSADSENSLRKSTTYLPLYTLVLLFIFFVGFAAIGYLHLSDPNLVLMKIALTVLPPWVLGFVGGAGLLAAIVPASMLMIVVATLVSKNVIQATICRQITNHTAGIVAKALVPVIALVAVFFTIHESRGIVALLLLGYSYVTQLFPALLGSILPRPFGTKYGAAAGILSGIIVVTYLTFSHLKITQLIESLPAAFDHLNIGVYALVVNFVVFFCVSAVTSATRLHPE